MEKTMTICGETFEVLEPSNLAMVGHSKPDYASDDIWEAYRRPSQTKVRVWHAWHDWYENVKEKYNLGFWDGECDMWIESHNAQFYTIGGFFLIPDPEYGELTYYRYRITANHKYIWNSSNC